MPKQHQHETEMTSEKLAKVLSEAFARASIYSLEALRDDEKVRKAATFAHREMPLFARLGINATIGEQGFVLLVFGLRDYMVTHEIFDPAKINAAKIRELFWKLFGFKKSSKKLESGGRVKYLKLVPRGRERAISLRIRKLQQGGLVLGRKKGCDVILSDTSVSGRHAKIWCDGQGHVVIDDLESSNGTRKNGTLIKQGVLGSGDALTLGEVTYSVQFTR